MQRNAIILSILLFISKLFGIVRETVLAKYYGATAYADIYLTASLIPNVVFGLISSGLVSTFIPIYSQIDHDEGQESADKFFNNVLNIVFIITLFMVLLGLIYTEPLVKLFASGFDQEMLNITVDFVKISLWAILFNGMFSLFGSYLDYHGKFFVSPVSGFLMNTITILSIIISAKSKPVVLAYGILLSAIFQVLLQFIIIKLKTPYRHSWLINLKDKHLKPMILMAGPIILGASVEQLNNIIDRSMASAQGVGAISILNYSSKLSSAIISLFVSAIVTVAFPELTRKAAEKDYDGLAQLTHKALDLTLLIVLPASVGMFILSEPIINLFYGRGVFADDPQALLLTTYSLMAYSLGVIANAYRLMLTRVAFSLKDSITPVKSAIVTVAINILLNIIFSQILGVPGLALATTLSTFVGTWLLKRNIEARIGVNEKTSENKKRLKIILATVVMGIIVYLSTYMWSFQSSASTLFISAFIGASSYLIVVLGLKIISIDEIKELF